ncbi:MAG TPA: aminotransferase class III-fold pyridoxal phosphate-dependent enzyme [Bryobacteraceae bacterium]|nr:aminotransferase class III-fold pyridoxal phosphate-dependent enzyme [Bryobacteraceae bacterium]
MHRAEGLSYWDINGKRYFDGIGGIFAATLGHGHPRVLDAVRKQLDVMTFAPPLHSVADVTLDFIEKLGNVAPANLTFVKPYSGGSESIESALKFARQYFRQTGRPGKYKFISRYMAYHGATFGAMAASGTGSRKSSFEPHLAGFLKVAPPTYYRSQFSDWEECNRFCARLFEDVILMEDPDTVAGILLEPVGNTGGIVTPTPEYFRLVRQICDKYDVLLIFDEVITGYGKTGAMFAAQALGVTPDILCGGKGLSSGVIPLGAMIAHQDLGDSFRGPAEQMLSFAHGHTYAGHPLACAVGIAVLDEIVEKQLARKAAVLGAYLASKLECLKKYGVVREVRGLGMLRGVELVKDTTHMQPFPELGRVLRRTALDNGLILRVDPSWFAVSPALTAERSDVDELCHLIEKSLVDALRQVGL